MNKKLFLYSISGLMMFCSCSNSGKNEGGNDEQIEGKILVAYFSATGTTKRVAEELSQIFDASLFEIEPVKPYSEADLNWQDSTSRSSIEMKKDLSIRPEIKNKVENIKQYETVFLGFPIWWYIAPTIINTFIEENNLEGKTVYCFATSGGSPIGPCVENLKKQYPKIDWKEGKLLNNVSPADINEWKRQLNM